MKTKTKKNKTIRKGKREYENDDVDDDACEEEVKLRKRIRHKKENGIKTKKKRTEDDEEGGVTKRTK